MNDNIIVIIRTNNIIYLVDNKIFPRNFIVCFIVIYSYMKRNQKSEIKKCITLFSICQTYLKHTVYHCRIIASFPRYQYDALGYRSYNAVMAEAATGVTAPRFVHSPNTFDF